MTRRRKTKAAKQAENRIFLTVVVVIVLVIVVYAVVSPIINGLNKQSKLDSSLMIGEPATLEIDGVSMTIESINKVEMEDYKLPESAVVPDGTELFEFSYKLENPEDAYQTDISEFDFYRMNAQGQIQEAGDEFDTNHGLGNLLNAGESAEDSLYFAVNPGETFFIVRSNGAEHGLNRHGTNSVEDIEPLIKLEQGFKFTPDGEGYRIETITGEEAAALWDGYMPTLYEDEAEINAKLGRE